MSAAVATNSAALPARRVQAARGETSPVTSSRPVVRGFFASYQRSATRFIAMAAVRAATTATATRTSRHASSDARGATSTTALAANGRANSEWESLTIRARATTPFALRGGA